MRRRIEIIRHYIPGGDVIEIIIHNNDGLDSIKISLQDFTQAVAFINETPDPNIAADGKGTTILEPES